MDVFVCEEGEWELLERVEVTPSTNPPGPPMDGATVAWWQRQRDSVRESACQSQLASVEAVHNIDIHVPTFERLCAGEEPTSTVPATDPPRNGEPFTVAELESALVGPIIDWVATPSGPTYDAIAGSANTLLRAGRPFPEVPQVMDSAAIENALRRLRVYPGSDTDVYWAIRTLGYVVPGLPFILGDGSHVVGSEIPAGRYRTVGPVSDCYWERQNAAGETIDNNFVISAPQVIMNVQGSDFAVYSEDCGPWILDG